MHVDRLVDGFAAAGYQLVDSLSDGRRPPGHWVLIGDEEIDGVATQLEVLIRPSYPFTSPKVRATDGAGGNSWHQDPDGWFCLWDEATTEPSAWATRDVVIDRVKGWLAASRSGWPDDAPDMDLDRYWSRADGLVLYDQLPAGGWVRLTKPLPIGGGTVWKVVGNGRSTKRNRAAGYVIDIGEPDRPPRTAFDLIDRMANDQATRFQRALDQREVGWVIAKYTRRGNPGVLVLRASYESDLALKAVTAASSGTAVRRLRSGPHAAAIAVSPVLVIGLGGIGSFLTDELARAGVTRMTLVDGDTLLPGNLVRHALRDDSIGWNKAAAMKRHLTTVWGLDPAGIEVVQFDVVDLETAVTLMERCDVAVDATGSAAAGTALISASDMLDRPLISVATTMEGRVIRVDRFPRQDWETSAPDPALEPTGRDPLYESGCGSPVSLTPPWAVSMAAAQAARAVIASLTGHDVPPSYVQTITVEAATP